MIATPGLCISFDVLCTHSCYLVKHGMLTLVCKIRCYRNDHYSYYFHHSDNTKDHANFQHKQFQFGLSLFQPCICFLLLFFRTLTKSLCFVCCAYSCPCNISFLHTYYIYRAIKLCVLSRASPTNSVSSEWCTRILCKLSYMKGCLPCSAPHHIWWQKLMNKLSLSLPD